MLTPRQVSHDHCRFSRRLPASILGHAAVGPVAPVVEATTPVKRERLFQCEHFELWRLSGQAPFTVGSQMRRACWSASRVTGQVGARRFHLCRRKRRCAGSCRQWSGACPFQPQRCSELAGNCASGGRPMKKLIVYDLDGTLAESKSSLDAEMAATAARPSRHSQSGRDFGRRLAAV